MRSGSLLLNCPGCMRRVEVASGSREGSSSCPFCGECFAYGDAEATLDRPLMLMHKSRSTALAALLGATLTLGACSKKMGPDPDATLYGAPPIDEPVDKPEEPHNIEAAEDMSSSNDAGASADSDAKSTTTEAATTPPETKDAPAEKKAPVDKESTP